MRLFNQIGLIRWWIMHSNAFRSSRVEKFRRTLKQSFITTTTIWYITSSLNHLDNLSKTVAKALFHKKIVFLYFISTVYSRSLKIHPQLHISLKFFLPTTNAWRNARTRSVFVPKNNRVIIFNNKYLCKNHFLDLDCQLVTYFLHGYNCFKLVKIWITTYFKISKIECKLWKN